VKKVGVSLLELPAVLSVLCGSIVAGTLQAKTRVSAIRKTMLEGHVGVAVVIVVVR
jgi:hypothetical protein